MAASPRLHSHLTLVTQDITQQIEPDHVCACMHPPSDVADDDGVPADADRTRPHAFSPMLGMDPNDRLSEDVLVGLAPDFSGVTGHLARPDHCMGPTCNPRAFPNEPPD